MQIASVEKINQVELVAAFKEPVHCCFKLPN